MDGSFPDPIPGVGLTSEQGLTVTFIIPIRGLPLQLHDTDTRSREMKFGQTLVFYVLIPKTFDHISKGNSKMVKITLES